jgi:hypothetical protein
MGKAIPKTFISSTKKYDHRVQLNFLYYSKVKLIITPAIRTCNIYVPSTWPAAGNSSRKHSAGFFPTNRYHFRIVITDNVFNQ